MLTAFSISNHNLIVDRFAPTDARDRDGKTVSRDGDDVLA